MKNKIFGLLILVFLLLGCQIKQNTYRTFVDDNIPNNIKSEVLSLDNRIIEAIKSNHPKNISDLISQKLLENGRDNLDSLLCFSYKILKDAKFKKLNYLYVENSTNNVSNTIFSGFKSETDYIIHYKAINNNTFISLYTAEIIPNEILITFIYGKTKSGWKLYHLQFGTYSLYGKTAIDYYKIAKRFDSLGYLADEANQLNLAQQCLKPGNQLWQWQKENDIISLQMSVMAKINDSYHFPIIVQEIPTKPQIYAVSLQPFNNRIETVIRYYSKINFADSTRLKKENIELQKLIGTIFKGIDIDKEYLIYQATDEIPVIPQKKIQQYGFVQKFNR